MAASCQIYVLHNQLLNALSNVQINSRIPSENSYATASVLPYVQGPLPPLAEPVGHANHIDVTLHDKRRHMSSRCGQCI